MEEMIFAIFAPVVVGAALFAVVYLTASTIVGFYLWFGRQSDESVSPSPDDL